MQEWPFDDINTTQFTWVDTIIGHIVGELYTYTNTFCFVVRAWFMAQLILCTGWTFKHIWNLFAPALKLVNDLYLPIHYMHVCMIFFAHLFFVYIIISFLYYLVLCRFIENLKIYILFKVFLFSRLIFFFDSSTFSSKQIQNTNLEKEICSIKYALMLKNL